MKKTTALMICRHSGTYYFMYVEILETSLLKITKVILLLLFLFSVPFSLRSEVAPRKTQD